VSRRQLPMPADAGALLAQIPAEFVDDGCSNSPDSWMGFRLAPYCRIHDWRHCTRAHAAGVMTDGAKVAAAYELGRFIKAVLPFRWRWVGWMYRSVILFAAGWGSWDSCGPERPKGANAEQRAAGLCRHSMPRPGWMV